MDEPVAEVSRLLNAACGRSKVELFEMVVCSCQPGHAWVGTGQSISEQFAYSPVSLSEARRDHDRRLRQGWVVVAAFPGYGNPCPGPIATDEWFDEISDFASIEYEFCSPRLVYWSDFDWEREVYAEAYLQTKFRIAGTNFCLFERFLVDDQTDGPTVTGDWVEATFEVQCLVRTRGPELEQRYLDALTASGTCLADVVREMLSE